MTALLGRIADAIWTPAEPHDRFEEWCLLAHRWGLVALPLWLLAVAFN